MASKYKRKLGGYPSFSVVGSMFLALFVLGIFGTFVIISRNVTQGIQENIQVQVYLNKELSETQKQRVERTISDKPFVLKKEETPVVSFVSKEEAAKIFIDETGEDFYEFLGDNPLRDSYVVNIDLTATDSLTMDAVSEELGGIAGVFEVDYVESVISDINRNITRISIILLVFAGILLLVVIVLINNTIKLALFSQRFLIRSMQLVGARPGFIRQPFLRRSFLQGTLAGCIAGSILLGLLTYAEAYYPELTQLYSFNALIVLFLGLLLVGGLVGFAGTYRAMKKYMSLSLDELY